jgi:alkylation response protein AidB-like acyl-CoA dehydrogenase
MDLNNFAAVAHDDERLATLRADVRHFLAGERAAGAFTRATGWDHWDPAFSRKVGARGWIGMTWPLRYGGQARSSLERFVVTEELLAAGAPVRAHSVRCCSASARSSKKAPICRALQAANCSSVTA